MSKKNVVVLSGTGSIGQAIARRVERGRWVSGSDFLIDGGTTALYWYGDLQYLKTTH